MKHVILVIILSMAAELLAQPALRPVSQDLTGDLLTGLNADFEQGDKGWNKTDRQGNSTLGFTAEGLSVNSVSKTHNVSIERGIPAQRLKQRVGNTPVILAVTARTHAPIQGKSLTFGLWWYQNNWKRASRDSILRVNITNSTGGKWQTFHSPATSIPEDAGVMRMGGGLYQAQGTGDIRRVQLFAAKADFQLSGLQDIKEITIRNHRGNLVYRGTSTRMQLPYPYLGFTCTAVKKDGSQMTCAWPQGGLFADDTKIRQIFLSPQASRFHQCIAREVQRIIQNMTGECLPIRYREKLTRQQMKGALIVGNTLYDTDFLKAKMNGWQGKAITRVIHGGAIFAGLTSTDVADAVYRTFERAGCRFYVAPARIDPYAHETWTIAETFPRNRIIRLTGTLIEQPRFTHYDGITGERFTTKEYKNKVYGPMWGSHCNDLMVPYSIYGKTHPEYYSLLPNGKRLGPVSSMGIHLCLSNPDVVEIAADNIAAWIRQQPQNLIFPIGPGDGPNWCVCPKCTELDTPKTGFSGRYWDFNQRLVNILAPQFPDKAFEFTAYTPLTETPPAKLSVPPNVRVNLCNYCWGGTRSQHQNLKALPNRLGYRNLMRWLKLLKHPGQLIIGEYPPAYSMQPTAGWKAMFEKMTFYAQFPQIGGWGTCGYARNCFHHYSAFIIRHLDWNPHQDIRKLTDEFFPAFYGNSAQTMRQIYELMATMTDEKPIGGMCEYYSPGMFTSLESDNFLQLFKKAQEEADDDQVRQRILYDKYPFLVTNLTDFNPANGKAKPDQAFARKLQEMLKIYREIRDPEWMIMRPGRHLTNPPIRMQENYEQWLQGIAGISCGGKHLYDAPIITELINAKDPLNVLKEKANPALYAPMGMNIRLTQLTPQLTTPTCPAKILNQELPDAPMAELWDAKASTKKQTKVATLTTGNTYSFALPYIMNPYDCQVEILAFSKQPGTQTLQFILNGETERRQTVNTQVFLTPKQWTRFVIQFKATSIIPNYEAFRHVPEDQLDFGMDSNFNKIRLTLKGKEGESMYIGRMRMLY